MATDNYRLRNRLFPSGGRIDTVEDRAEGVFDTSHAVLTDSFRAWESLDGFRRGADRNKRYVFGDQWGDSVKGSDGCFRTERDEIRLQGNVPITNNRLRGIVRSVSGVFQSNRTEPVCVARERNGQLRSEVMTATLQYAYQLNKVWNLDVANLNNFLISGLAASKVTFGFRDGKMDAWVNNVSYSRMFFDGRMDDVRQWDCRLVGELEDLSVYDVMARYAAGSRRRADRIRDIYSYVNRERLSGLSSAYTKDVRKFRQFFMPDDDVSCRVITTWRREAKERLLVHDVLTGEYYKTEVSAVDRLEAINRDRMAAQSSAGVAAGQMKLLRYQWFVDNYWYFYNQAPTGEVLQEGETPYAHGSHPYSFKLYTFYDGQVFPFVSDFIDQQRYINRLITLQDFMMRAAAKGVLMIPEHCLEGSGRTPEEFASDWVKFNGVIVYTDKPGGARPEQVTANSTALGVYDMLSLQMKLLEDISGVQGALQGRTPNAGTPAALYSQQTQNASTSLSEIFDVYRMLREERDMKLLKTIQQYYSEPRFITTQGSELSVYDPEDIGDTDFDLSIIESTATPAFRMVINDMLLNLLNGGHVTIKEVLENGTFPFSDKLLQSINRREAQMAGQGVPSGGSVPQTPEQFPDEVKNEVEREANPSVMRMYNQLTG